MRALRGFEKTKGSDNSMTLSAVQNLAILKARQGYFIEAEKLFERAYKGRRRSLGDHHKDTIECALMLRMLTATKHKWVELPQGALLLRHIEENPFT